MSNFRWLNKQGVECDAGFVLQSMDRYYYHYVEAGKTLKVTVEPCRESGRYFEEISLSSLSTWHAPHHGLSLSLQEQARIKANITEALRFMNIDHRYV